MSINRIILSACLLLVMLGLSACLATPTSPIFSTANLEQAQMAEKAGDYAAAGGFYLLHAAEVSSPQKDATNLRAAFAFSKARDNERAFLALSEIDRDQLSYVSQIDSVILESRLLLNSHQPTEALHLLAPYDLSQASVGQQRAALKVKADAFEATQDWVNKARTHNVLALLERRDVAKENQHLALWLALQMLSTEQLASALTLRAPHIEEGWFALAYALKANNTNPRGQRAAVAQWQQNYPNHPADPKVYSQITMAGTATASLPSTINHGQIALLLADKGTYAAVAKAVKQGFTAAYYADKSDAKINFYGVTTEGNTSNVRQQYDQAVADGAQVVIGPLNKAALQILTESGMLPVPVLALNQLNGGIFVDNLYQFGLAPEGEARAVARLAKQKGYRHSLVLAPNSDWGRRVVAAFNDDWLYSGGDTVSTGWYDPSKNDFSATVRPLMRQRKSADFVFLVARPQLARQLMPQMRFHRLGRKPVLATSHIYAGKPDARQDVDLNRIHLVDMPWVFPELAAKDPAFKQLESLNIANLDKLKRLYALGADAYRLLPNLVALQNNGNQFKGATGTLSVDNSGYIHRALLPAYFTKGLLKLTATP